MNSIANTLEPNGRKTSHISSELRNKVIVGLKHLVIDLKPPSAHISENLIKNIDALKQCHAEPALFGLTAKLRDAVIANDDSEFEKHREIFSRWQFENSQVGDRPKVNILCSEHYKSDDKVQILRDGFKDDAGLTSQLVCPDLGECARQHRTIQRAFDIFEKLSLQWASEIYATVSEVILSVNATPVEGRNFAGGSVFELYGAILFNPYYRKDIGHALMTLVHESSHLRLFTYHLNDEILLNDDQAIYASPLRRQLRSIEGIYHAAWVCARMVIAARTILTAPKVHEYISDEEYQSLKSDMLNNHKYFLDSYTVIKENGIMTALGKKIMDDAYRGVTLV